MLNEPAKERLRTLTVEAILAVRAVYLASPGANVLKHWSQLESRVRAAARTTSSPQEWQTKLCRDLQLPALNSAACQAFVDLAHEVTERACANDWLALVDDEVGYMMALARLAADARRDERERVQLDREKIETAAETWLGKAE